MGLTAPSRAHQRGSPRHHHCGCSLEQRWLLTMNGVDANGGGAGAGGGAVSRRVLERRG